MASFLKTAIKTKTKSSGDRYKLPDDKRDHAIRIVPFAPDGSWSFKVLQHWTPDPAGESQFDKSFVCRQDQPKAHILKDGEEALPTFGLECPFEVRNEQVAVEIEEFSQKGDPASKAKVKFLRALEWALKNQESYFLQILDREDPSALKEFWAQPKLHEVILDAYTDFAVNVTGVQDREALMELDDSQIPDLFDVMKGRDILLRKTPKSTGNGFVFHASISDKETPLANTPAEIKSLLSQIKDPVKLVKTLIEEQAADIDAAVEALEQRVKLKQNSHKPIKGAEASDEDLFKGAKGSRIGNAGSLKEDTLPHLEAVDTGNGEDTPDFADDPEEAAFTQAATPAKPASLARPKSRVAQELANLDA